MAAEHPVLLSRGQPGVERDDLGAREVGEVVGGVADLPLAGQEDQDVAGSLPGQLGDSRADRLGLVALDRLTFLVVLRQLQQRAVVALVTMTFRSGRRGSRRFR